MVGFFAAFTAGAADVAPAAPLELRDRPGLGWDTAPIVVVEVASFKCTHCRAFHQTIFPKLRAEYVDTGKVRWVVLNASDDPSDEFAPSFAIARCAQQQGKYWELLDSLFQVAHRPPSFLTDLVAKSAVVDPMELDLCVRDRATRKLVAADFADYVRLKIRGTPTFVVWKRRADGGQTETTIAGAQTLEYFRRVFDELLKTL